MEPYYQIDFSAAHCQFEVRANDIPVLHFEVVGQVGTMAPINMGIFKSGKQALSIKILPINEEQLVNKNAEFKYDIKLFDVSNNDFSFKQQLGGYQFPPVDTSKPHLELNYETTFMAEVPYVITDHDNTTPLIHNPNIRPMLMAAYHQVGSVIDSGDYERFRQMMAKRESIMATTMYLSKRESDARINDLINDFKEGFKYEAIGPDAKVHFYNNGKIAALKKPNGESALVLLNKKTSEELTIELSFYLPPGKIELEVI